MLFTLLHFINTIEFNIFGSKDAIRIAKDIFQGNFPLHGPKHSNGMYTFPAFYYFVSPLVYISDEPMFLYGSVAFLYIIGVLLLANYIYKNLVVLNVLFSFYFLPHMFGHYFLLHTSGIQTIFLFSCAYSFYR